MTALAAHARLAVCLVLVTQLNAALPEPPAQRQPWNQPSGTAVPDYITKVAATLFEAGLADPRGGDYRVIEIKGPGRDRKSLQTHGWVFPDLYAVCWNGLVYAVSHKGAPADLDHDVRTIAGAEPWSGRLLLHPADDPNAKKAPFWFDMQLGQTLAPTSIALLLRVGRPDLAAEIWQASESRDYFEKTGPVRQHEGEEGQWLSTAAETWFGMAYSRLVGAFQQGDDREAVEVAESLLQWESRVPASWREPKKWVPKHIPDLSFLNPVPALLADSKRRLPELSRSPLKPVKWVKGKPVVPKSLQEHASLRIAELIDRLEDVEGSKLAFPGPLVYALDPVYLYLLNEGKTAVEPLIDAYESDRRLTRTFDYSRPWSIEWAPIPVHRVIEILLGDLLGDPDRVKNFTPAELRAWWRQRQGGMGSIPSDRAVALSGR